MDDDDAARLIAGGLDQLGYGLSRLRPDQSGYITAEDYERITGEELDDSSTEGRKTMADLAAQHGMHNPDSTDRTARLFHQAGTAKSNRLCGDR
jgi:hypothetical protein